jgi:hypothetical protein
LIVYDQAFAGKVQSIVAGNVTYFSSSPNPTSPGYIDKNATTPFIYTRATSTSSTAPTALSNYALFENLSSATQTVTIHSISGSGPTSVAAFQIVDTSVPEASTAGYVLCALCGSGAVYRRRPGATK